MSSRRLTLEALEDRAVPATWGNPWPDATHLTVSFVPDGTDVGGQASRLFQSLDAIAPRAVWQGEMLRAMQAWASQLGVNVAVVSDDGSPMGTPGRPQSDPRFGDVRIGGGTYGTGVLTFSSPFDVTAGTWSGDIRVN